MYKHRISVLAINLFLAFFEGVFVFWQYARNKSEPQAAILWGYSAFRLTLLIVIGLILVFLVSIFIQSITSRKRVQKVDRSLDFVIAQTQIFWILLLLISSVYLALFLSDHRLGILASYRETLRPLLIWIGLISCQLLVSYMFLRERTLGRLGVYSDTLLPSVIAFAMLLLLVGFIAITRIGLDKDIIYWQDCGVPILFQQVLLAVVASGLLLVWKRRSDLILCVSLWVLAVVLWSNQPMRPSYNSLAPAPPNFQNYPFGDALRHDLTAQEYLIGQPMPADFFVKPFYSFLLVLFHLVGGDDYSLIVFLQILLLAWIPPAVYLLTRELSTPLAGVAAALLITFRESNAIALSNVIQVSNSRLLLSDVPTMGLMILLTWLLVKWSKRPNSGRGLPSVIGGTLGLLIITRGNPLVLIPFVLGAAFLVLRKSRGFLVDFLLPFSLGLLMALGPWFWHNYQITGKLVFQDPSSPYILDDQLVQLYSQNKDGNTEGQGVLRYIISDPLTAVQFISAHYFHNVAQSYIYLPQSLSIEPVAKYVVRFPFWSGWQGELTLVGLAMLPFNLGFLAIGLGSSWKKDRFAALMPLILGIGYNLSVAVTRRSGWRFNLPADWVTIIFFAIGLGQLVMYLYFLIEKDKTRLWVESEYTTGHINRPSFNPIFYYLVFLAISSGVAQGNRLFAARLDQSNAEEIPGLTSDFIEQDGASLVQGRVGYPVFLSQGQGILNYASLQYAEKPYNRLAFYVIGSPSRGVQLKTDAIPSNLPDGSEVIVAGCETDENYIDVLVVLLKSDPPVLYYREPFLEFHCPISNP